MGKASSAKKVARLAQRGRGKKIRFQGGTVFPVAVALVIALGVVLIGLSRHYSKADAVGPKLGSHWHVAYGVYVCDKYLDPFPDNKETSEEYQFLQIHSHGDGVMHWHPSNEQAINRSTGRSAKFDVFLGLYNVELTDSKLTVTGSELKEPGDDLVYEEGKSTCTVNGKEEPASLRTIVWDRYDKPDSRTVRTSKLGSERVLKDQQVFVVAFVADSVANGDIPLPPWATDLPELGASDNASATTLPNDSTVPSDSSAPADSSVTTSVAATPTVAGSTAAPTSTTATTTGN